jgi:hypothetical protein
MVALCAVLCAVAVAAKQIHLPSDPNAIVTSPKYSAAEGVYSFNITNSAFARNTDTINCVQMLLPNSMRSNITTPLPLLLVLPVEANLPGPTNNPAHDRGHYGNGLAEVQKTNFHNRYPHIVAMMSFPQTPWFGDNPNRKIMQESYILNTVLPSIKLQFNVSRNVKLLGFSKSGWGALTLLARYPTIFSTAAVWDSPSMLRNWTDIQRWDMPSVFGTPENLQLYLPSVLYSDPSTLTKLGSQPRLCLLGEHYFGSMATPHGNDSNLMLSVAANFSHTKSFHELLARNSIPHVFNNSLDVNHAWNTGWVPSALECLVTQL